MAGFAQRFLLLGLFALIARASDPYWKCKDSEDYAISQFMKKELTSSEPLYTHDPYRNLTQQMEKEIDAYLNNHEQVCALKYLDEQKINYTLATFPTSAEAEKAGYVITHQGHCASCSTTQDLAVYLKYPDLTDPIRKCGLWGILSEKWAMDCIKKVGFTDSCAQIWFYNSRNTKEKCLWPCMIDYIFDVPFTSGDYKLNKCLQCDEDKSGPVFKYYAGRTRRDSGLHSRIPRPPASIYNVTHCYYD